MWAKRTAAAAFIAGGGYLAYDIDRTGHHTRRDMPAGAFSISYKNGLRVFLIDVPNERNTRRYFGMPMKVPFYFQDAWSFCSPPSKEDEAQVTTFMRNREWPGERFEEKAMLA